MKRKFGLAVGWLGRLLNISEADDFPTERKAFTRPYQFADDPSSLGFSESGELVVALRTVFI